MSVKIIKENKSQRRNRVVKEAMSNEESPLELAQMSFETGHYFDSEDFDRAEDYEEYREYMDLGPSGFYEEYKDELDFDPDFVSEYGDEEFDEDFDKSARYKYTYQGPDPENDYERDLYNRSGQICKILKDNGNGNYEVEFEDGSQYDAQDDELEEIEESFRINEGVVEGNKVLQVTFDVEVPKNVNLSVQAMSGNTEFYKKLSKFLSSLGYEMAGDGIDTEDVTDMYKDN